MPRNWSPWTLWPSVSACGWRSRWRRRAPCIPTSRRLEEDAGADAQLLKRIADWCRRYTPLTALDPPDGVLLDIAGCAHLFGGEAALIEDLVTRIAGFGFAVRVGVAGTIGAAWAAARYAALSPWRWAGPVWGLRKETTNRVR